MMVSQLAPPAPFIPEEMHGEFPLISRLLVLRLAAIGDLPLAAIRDGAPVLTRLGHKLGAALSAAAPRLGSELAGDGADRLASFMARALTRYMMRKNQYLPLPPGWDNMTNQLYGLFLDEFMKGAGKERAALHALGLHQRRLRALLSIREAGTNRHDEPVCATYSPVLQLRLLRLDPDRFLGPVLDLGCGENGALVHHLRASGRDDAWGLDALCETSGPLIRGSWLEATFRAGSFGTIIAHLSFSLHLLRAHHSESRSTAARHVQIYMRILEALKPGGGFHYAPSLPFLEQLLPPRRWSVRRWSLAMHASAFEATSVTALPA